MLTDTYMYVHEVVLCDAYESCLMFLFFFFFSYYISCKYILDKHYGGNIHFQEAQRSESHLFPAVRTYMYINKSRNSRKVTEPSAAAHRIKPYLVSSYQEPAVLDSYKEGESKMRSAKRDDKTKGNSKAEIHGKSGIGGWKNKEIMISKYRSFTNLQKNKMFCTQFQCEMH